MQIVQIHRARREVVAVVASCDYCQQLIENEDVESCWMVFAEPADDQQMAEVATVPTLWVHDGRCLNDWLYRESHKPGAHDRLYGGWQVKDVSKGGVAITAFDPAQAHPPTITRESVQAYLDAMIAASPLMPLATEDETHQSDLGVSQEG